MIQKATYLISGLLPLGRPSVAKTEVGGRPVVVKTDLGQNRARITWRVKKIVILFRGDTSAHDDVFVDVYPRKEVG